MIDMIRVGQSRNLLRASSSLSEIWPRSAHHHPGQRRQSAARTGLTKVRTRSHVQKLRNSLQTERHPQKKVGYQAHSLRHLHIANPKTVPSRGLFLYVSKGECRYHLLFGDCPSAQDRSLDAHRLFPPALRPQRDRFKITIHFNELTGSRCARVSPVPACFDADRDTTRAAWWFAWLGRFARSL